jgi:hypothetical protein
MPTVYAAICRRNCIFFSIFRLETFGGTRCGLCTRQEPCWQTSINGRHCVEELYAHKLLVLSKMALSFNHKVHTRTNTWSLFIFACGGTPSFQGGTPLAQSTSSSSSPPRASIHDPLRDHSIVQTIPT